MCIVDNALDLKEQPALKDLVVVETLESRTPTGGYDLVVVDLDGDLRDPVEMIKQLLEKDSE